MQKAFLAFRGARALLGTEPLMPREKLHGNLWLHSFRSGVHMSFLLVSLSLGTGLDLFP